ncbi:PAS domain S-box-containing protein/diguanylate cyclase (GGDEF)-like protein [Jatrophihabitans sp. GAS493]|uniref:sensor domain-containing diguanylate cyclase n=1 Tax=Jatrophihabitans sp. GAS493 TaxID=1907575 RepID=UPI000BB9248A|nr:diguanylate cyclase [Jatrophihabitans sp. GAS493]SOD74896.1 PAS domain S-box-containing protein/diguanylate cyclase (GGDEF)-like protein [Jatrophihabitans sp. GAS493]
MLTSPHEQRRVAALHAYNVLDTEPEPSFDAITRLAAQLADAPMALVGLIDESRQWFKSKQGMTGCETPRDDTFCRYALHSSDILVIPDAQLDPRFAANPQVTGAPFIRFYAGVPLVSDDGYVLGTLCVLDTAPRELTEVQYDQLRALASQVMAQLLLRKHTYTLAAEVAARQAAEQAARDSETRWRTLVEASPVGIALSDEHGRYLTANAALCSILGRRHDQLIGRTSASFTHKDDLESYNATGETIVAHGGVARVERRCYRPDGDLRWLWLTLTHTPGPQGQTWTLAHAEDITDRKLSEQALRESEADLAAVAQVVRKIQSGADARESVVQAGLRLASASYVSLVEPSGDGSTLTVTAATEPALVGASVAIDPSSATSRTFLTGEAFFSAHTAGHPLISAALLELTGARTVYIVPVYSAEAISAVLIVAWSHELSSMDDRRARVVALLADNAGVALRQAGLLAELHTLASTDPLTGLANRRSWDQRLESLMERAHEDGTPLTIAVADLDHFKKFNDRHGHLAGDRMLRDFADSMLSQLRTGDFAARWGGEEFTVALPNCAQSEAIRVLNRVRLSVPHDSTCSIGLATWDDREDADALLRRADAALYAAKQAGRNQTLAA